MAAFSRRGCICSWLDKKEFQGLVRACSFGWTDADADKVFDAYDDGDGKFDQSEWTKVVLQMNQSVGVAIVSEEVCCLQPTICGALLCCPCFLCTAGLSFVGFQCCLFWMGRDARSKGATRFLTDLPPAGRFHPYTPQPGEVRFAEFRVGDQVEVKSAEDLQKVFTSPHSQWTKGFGKRVKNNTQVRVWFAGQQVVVKELDSADNTVLLKRVTTEGKEQTVWFTPEMLARNLGQVPTASPASLASGPQAPVETPTPQVAVSESGGMGVADAI